MMRHPFLLTFTLSQSIKAQKRCYTNILEPLSFLGCMSRI